MNNKPIGWSKPNLWALLIVFATGVEMVGVTWSMDWPGLPNNKVGVGILLILAGMILLLFGICGWLDWSRQYEILERDKFDANKSRT